METTNFFQVWKIKKKGPRPMCLLLRSKTSHLLNSKYHSWKRQSSRFTLSCDRNGLVRVPQTLWQGRPPHLVSQQVVNFFDGSLFPFGHYYVVILSWKMLWGKYGRQGPLGFPLQLNIEILEIVTECYHLIPLHRAAEITSLSQQRRLS